MELAHTLVFEVTEGSYTILRGRLAKITAYNGNHDSGLVQLVGIAADGRVVSAWFDPDDEIEVVR